MYCPTKFKLVAILSLCASLNVVGASEITVSDASSELSPLQARAIALSSYTANSKDVSSKWSKFDRQFAQLQKANEITDSDIPEHVGSISSDSGSSNNLIDAAGIARQKINADLLREDITRVDPGVSVSSGVASLDRKSVVKSDPVVEEVAAANSSVNISTDAPSSSKLNSSVTKVSVGNSYERLSTLTRQFDLNKDGVVSYSEFEVFQFDRFFRYDRNHDSRISSDEILYGSTTASSQTIRKKMLEQLDIDGDGSISTEEYRVAVVSRFKILDSDGDGALGSVR